MIDWSHAIRSRLLVSFGYDGYDRIVIPAAYGLNQKTGNRLVRAYQVGGGDATRPLPTWSLFNADKVDGGRVTDECFEADPPGYERTTAL